MKCNHKFVFLEKKDELTFLAKLSSHPESFKVKTYYVFFCEKCLDMVVKKEVKIKKEK